MSSLTPPLFPEADAPHGWLVVACADHVARGRKDGFVQACHGKEAPLRRMRPGDLVACYSPTQGFQGGERLQAFTALGLVAPGEPFLFDMGRGFVPWRKNVHWLETRSLPLEELKARLDLTKDPHWGWKLRRGHLALSLKDARLLAESMMDPLTLQTLSGF